MAGGTKGGLPRNGAEAEVELRDTMPWRSLHLPTHSLHCFETLESSSCLLVL